MYYDWIIVVWMKSEKNASYNWNKVLKIYKLFRLETRFKEVIKPERWWDKKLKWCNTLKSKLRSDKSIMCKFLK